MRSEATTPSAPEPTKEADALELKDILRMFGEDYGDDEREWYNAKKRLSTRIRNMEEQTGIPILFGKKGSRLWTTRQCLRHAWPHIVPQEAPVAEQVAEVAEGIVEAFEERVATLEAKVDVLAAAVGRSNSSPAFA